MKGKNEDLRSIGTQLNATNLLEGSVRKAGARVRITAQLIEAAGGSHLWSQQFDRELTDVFAVQEEIARAVVAALKLKLLPAAHAAQRTVNPEAHDQYLFGRAFLERGSGGAYVHAVQALRKSVELDPNYAPAWAALAAALFWQGDSTGDARRDWPEGKAAAEKAIALAPNLAEAYSAHALFRANLLRDEKGALADAERARSLHPGGVEIQVYYATRLASIGRLPEAIAALQKVTAQDPLSAEGWVRLGNCYLGAGLLDLAEAAAKRALDISAEHARAARTLGFAYLLGHRLEEARVAFHRSSNPLFVEMGDAMIEHTLGHAAESQRVLERILTSPFALGASYQVAQIYAWRGEADRAFEVLGQAFESHDAGLGYLKYDPLLGSLRGDPRYTALLRNMNLPLD
jgi:tetratricopeptide (TPR) repeat protein